MAKKKRIAKRAKKKDIKIAPRIAAFWIFLSVILVSGSCYLSFFANALKKKKRTMQEKIFIRTLVQTSSIRESLPSDFLAQLMGLSEDIPSTIASFSPQSAKMQLEKFCLIKKAEVKKLKEGGVYIDYQMREPQYWMGDFQNAALDKDGVIIPYFPFFSPKNMTQIYLGLKKNEMKDLHWGSYLANPPLSLAVAVFHAFHALDKQEGMQLVKIDVSKANSSSFGAREIVAVVTDKFVGEEPLSFHYYLRMPVKNYEKALANFTVLREEMKKHANKDSPKEKIVDLRISQLAFLEE